MSKKVLKVGILSREEYKKRTIAIAKNQYKPKRGEPKIWFESVQSMAQVLSTGNQKLLKAIVEQEPNSLKELEKITGKKSSNLSRTLKLLARYGIVDLEKKNRSIKRWPLVAASVASLCLGLLVVLWQFGAEE